MPDADPPEDSAPWWWQVLSGSSEVPVLARGPAESMAQARFMTETAMHMLKGAVLGMAGGPGGQVDSCRRTTDGHWRWMPWPPEPEHEHAPIPGTIYSVSGLPANLSFSGHYPVEAHCSCGFMIRRERIGMPGDGSKWQSTGRRPGDPG